MEVVNTLAYCYEGTITTAKSFMVQAPDPKGLTLHANIGLGQNSLPVTNNLPHYFEIDSSKTCRRTPRLMKFMKLIYIGQKISSKPFAKLTAIKAVLALPWLPCDAAKKRISFFHIDRSIP